MSGEMQKIIARAGTVIRDNDGEPAYRVRHDIVGNARVLAEMFEGIDRPDPVSGKRIPQFMVDWMRAVSLSNG